jgi:hypothetical protein
MKELEIIQAAMQPVVLISAGGLIVLSMNSRLIGIVARLRFFNKDMHTVILSGNAEETSLLESQTKELTHRGNWIRKAMIYTVIGITGVMGTCLLLGIGVYVEFVHSIALLVFVLSIMSMMAGTTYYIRELYISLKPVQEECRLRRSISTATLRRNLTAVSEIEHCDDIGLCIEDHH